MHTKNTKYEFQKKKKSKIKNKGTFQWSLKLQTKSATK